ncbi:hypothetical protein BJ170DRAFT_295896 [Xylariales sp. AK1849]|nr:hypothetical protein BJ170DRAFT_295896 [Xylariales sp. AK1849]
MSAPTPKPSWMAVNTNSPNAAFRSLTIPSTEEITKLLDQLRAQHPEHSFTPTDLASALRKLAVNKQAGGMNASGTAVSTAAIPAAGDGVATTPEKGRGAATPTTPTTVPPMDLKIPSFSSAKGKRKGPPAPLDLSLPGAAPPSSRKKVTHYIAYASNLTDGRPPSVPAIEKFTNGNQQSSPDNSTGSEVHLLKTPLATLQPEEAKHSPVQIKLMKSPVGVLTEEFANFDLKTPVTTKFAPDDCTLFPKLEPIPKPSPVPVIRRLDRVLAARDHGTGRRLKAKRFDLIASLSRVPELIIAVCKYMRPVDVLSLYCVSTTFHQTINSFLKSSIKVWTRYLAADAADVFRWTDPMYKHLSLIDPAGRPLTSPPPEHSPRFARRVPSLKWYLMVALRDDAVIDILAHLARQGLRTPQGTKTALLKMWMLMDLPTTAERRALIQRRGVFADQDLYNIQLFCMKLALLFNDPIYGPEDCGILELVLGQKSLYALWEMMFGHRYRTLIELVQMKVRYNLGFSWVMVPGFGLHAIVDPKWMRDTLGVPRDEIGRNHLEHWGKHGIWVPRLMPPTLLVVEEAARRQLDLEDHLMPMVMWGNVDVDTGRNLYPTEDEIWMHDSAHKNRSVDTSLEYDVFHIKNAQWYDLDELERKKVILAQQVREDSVNRWDSHKYDDPSETDADNIEHNLTFQEIFSEMAGKDQKNPTFRVDANMNAIPAHLIPHDIPGPLTAQLDLEVMKLDHGYQSDSSDETEAAAADDVVSHEQELDPSSWSPLNPDHGILTPTTSQREVLETTRAHPRTDTNDDLEDERFVSDEDTDTWSIWTDMQDDIFASIFALADDDEADTTTAVSSDNDGA